MRLKCSREVAANIRRFRQLQPRFIHQGGGAQGSAGVAAPHARSQPTQLFIRDAEQLVQRFSLCGGRFGSLRLRIRGPCEKTSPP